MIETDRIAVPDWLIPRWQYVVELLCSYVQPRVTDTTGILTFGSFVNGDYAVIEFDGTFVPLSDFEFTIVTPEKPSVEDLAKIEAEFTRIEEESYFSLGWPRVHIEARWISINNFVNRPSSTFFFHHLLRNAVTVWGYDYLPAISIRSPESIDVRDLRSKLSSLLLDALITRVPLAGMNGHDSFIANVQCRHSLATCGAKLGLMIAANRIGTAPTCYAETLEILRKQIPDIHDAIEACIRWRKNPNVSLKNVAATCLHVARDFSYELYDYPRDSIPWFDAREPMSLDGSCHNRKWITGEALALIGELALKGSSLFRDHKWLSRRDEMFRSAAKGFRQGKRFFQRFISSYT